MSPLPGWRLVWSLYGRFWCRSSLEVLSVAHGRAGMWSRAMWQPSLTSRALAANSSPTTIAGTPPSKRAPFACGSHSGGLWMAV